MSGSSFPSGFQSASRTHSDPCPEVIDRVVSDADVTVISRRDAPDAVVMSLDTFNSWMETVRLLKTPANAAHLAKSIRQLRAGKTRARALVDE